MCNIQTGVTDDTKIERQPNKVYRLRAIMSVIRKHEAMEISALILISSLLIPAIRHISLET